MTEVETRQYDDDSSVDNEGGGSSSCPNRRCLKIGLAAAAVTALGLGLGLGLGMNKKNDSAAAVSSSNNAVVGGDWGSSYECADEYYGKAGKTKGGKTKGGYNDGYYYEGKSGKTKGGKSGSHGAPSFALVGSGGCLGGGHAGGAEDWGGGSGGLPYDHLHFSNYAGTLHQCQAKCAHIGGHGFRGIQHAGSAMICDCLYDDGTLPACPTAPMTDDQWGSPSDASDASACSPVVITPAGATGPIAHVNPVPSVQDLVCYRAAQHHGKSGKTKGAVANYYYDGEYYYGKSGKTKGARDLAAANDADDGWNAAPGGSAPGWPDEDDDYYYEGKSGKTKGGKSGSYADGYYYEGKSGKSGSKGCKSGGCGGSHGPPQGDKCVYPKPDVCDPWGPSPNPYGKSGKTKGGKTKGGGKSGKSGSHGHGGPSFALVGSGQCQGGNHAGGTDDWGSTSGGAFPYDHLQFSQFAGTLRQCQARCAAIGGHGFRGVEFTDAEDLCHCLYDDGTLPACPAMPGTDDAWGSPSDTSVCTPIYVEPAGAMGPITVVAPVPPIPDLVCYRTAHHQGKSGKSGSYGDDYYYGKSGKSGSKGCKSGGCGGYYYDDDDAWQWGSVAPSICYTKAPTPTPPTPTTPAPTSCSVRTFYFIGGVCTNEYPRDMEMRYNSLVECCVSNGYCEPGAVCPGRPGCPYVDICNPTDRPTPAPTDRPVVGPTDRPVVPVTARPTPAPTNRPTTPGVRPTNRPVPPPTGRPVPPLTARPVMPTNRPNPPPEPTNRPVMPTNRPNPPPSPTNRPVIPPPRPTNRPVAAPTGRPVVGPTGRPVAVDRPTGRPVNPTGRPVTRIETYSPTTGSTPTVSTEATGPPTVATDREQDV